MRRHRFQLARDGLGERIVRRASRRFNHSPSNIDDDIDGITTTTTTAVIIIIIPVSPPDPALGVLPRERLAARPRARVGVRLCARQSRSHHQTRAALSSSTQTTTTTAYVVVVVKARVIRG